MKYTYKLFQSCCSTEMAQGLAVQKKGQPPEPLHNNQIALPYVIENFLSEEECDRIISYSHHIDKEDGKVYKNGERQSDLRKSSIQWLFPNEGTNWIFNYIEQAIETANKSYNFSLYGFSRERK